MHISLGVIHKSISPKIADFFCLGGEGVVTFTVKNDKMD